MALDRQQDVVLVRQRARQISGALGFGLQDQVRIATAVSEVARALTQAAPGPTRHVHAFRVTPSDLEVRIGGGAAHGPSTTAIRCRKWRSSMHTA